MPDRIGRKTIIIAGLAIVLIFALLFALSQCDKRRSQGAQSRVERSQADAQSNSSMDAIATQGAAAGRERASEDLTRSNDRDIRASEGAGDQVKPGVDAAGRAALCKREAYRNDPKCKR